MDKIPGPFLPSDHDVVNEIAQLLESDQTDRASGSFDIDLEGVRARDQKRLTRAREIFATLSASNLPPQSLGQLAMLFQHGSEPEDYQKAQQLAGMAAAEGYESAKWLEAAAEDRYLLAIGQKQKWGTQFEYDGQGNVQQSPMMNDEDSGVTDLMRQERHIPARTDQIKAFLAGQ